MYIQGDLQAVFDALFHLGVIDPVLKMDWTEVLKDMPKYHQMYANIFEIVNDCGGDVQQIMDVLEEYNEEALGYLAMEVAREYADFHSRENLH